MYLDFARETFAVQRGSDEDLGQLGWAPPLDLHERVLLDDVGHLLLLLLALIHLLFQVCDLFRDRVKAVSICRTIRDRPDERSVRVLKRLMCSGSLVCYLAETEMNGPCPPCVQRAGQVSGS